LAWRNASGPPRSRRAAAPSRSRTALAKPALRVAQGLSLRASLSHEQRRPSSRIQQASRLRTTGYHPAPWSRRAGRGVSGAVVNVHGDVVVAAWPTCAGQESCAAQFDLAVAVAFRSKVSPPADPAPSADDCSSSTRGLSIRVVHSSWRGGLSRCCLRPQTSRPVELAAAASSGWARGGVRPAAARGARRGLHVDAQA
jgi:hypothetical protein